MLADKRFNMKKSDDNYLISKQKAFRKSKDIPLKDSIAKAKAAMIERDIMFKKPLPVSSTPLNDLSSKIFNRKREGEFEEALRYINNFIVPEILSPIKEVSSPIKEMPKPLSPLQRLKEVGFENMYSDYITSLDSQRKNPENGPHTYCRFVYPRIESGTLKQARKENKENKNVKDESKTSSKHCEYSSRQSL